VPFLGGHGTTVAWAEAEQAATCECAGDRHGLRNARTGLRAIVSGIVGTRLAEHAARSPDQSVAPASPSPSGRRVVRLGSMDHRVALARTEHRSWPGGAAIVGEAFGVTVPAFLAVLLAAVIVTNVADLARIRLDLAGADLIGTLALRVFLAIAMLGLQLAAVGDSVSLIAVAVLAQVLLTVLIAALLVYPLLKGREGAIGAAGFVGSDWARCRSDSPR